MSENVLNHFLSLLLSANYKHLVAKYYDDTVKVTLNNTIKAKEKRFGFGLLQQEMDLLHILQFKVVDIQYKGNRLSYGIYLVTKDEDHKIDFSEHRVLNKWKNNLIYYHKHLATNY